MLHFYHRGVTMILYIPSTARIFGTPRIQAASGLAPHERYTMVWCGTVLYVCVVQLGYTVVGLGTPGGA